MLDHFGFVNFVLARLMLNYGHFESLMADTVFDELKKALATTAAAESESEFLERTD